MSCFNFGCPGPCLVHNSPAPPRWHNCQISLHMTFLRKKHSGCTLHSETRSGHVMLFCSVSSTMRMLNKNRTFVATDIYCFLFSPDSQRPKLIHSHLLVWDIDKNCAHSFSQSKKNIWYMLQAQIWSLFGSRKLIVVFFIFEPTCARWVHMHHFLSVVCL